MVEAISSPSFAAESAMTEIENSEPMVLAPQKIQGIDWVRKCLARYPEIGWLANNKVAITQEGTAKQQGSYSLQLYGEQFPEFDRTVMTLHCLRLILDGSAVSYEQFVKDQPAGDKLSWESFQQLHQQGKKLLQSGSLYHLSEVEMAQAMETALVLGDIGKSKVAREKFGIDTPDHDDFYGDAMRSHPEEHCPSFRKLPEGAQKLLVNIANLAHYGHITHLEGGPAMFSSLKKSGIASSDPTALSFDLFVHTCDVAGARGQVNNSSSIVYTASTHRAMSAMAEAVRVLADPSKTEKDAYDAYVTKRAQWLGLDPQSGADRVLARIGAMFRLFKPEEAIILKKAIGELTEENRALVVAELEAQKGRTPTYMPAVLVNLADNKQLGSTKEERLIAAVTIGLPCLARVLVQYNSDTIPLNFNPVAGKAKEPNAQELLSKPANIDPKGLVTIP